MKIPNLSGNYLAVQEEEEYFILTKEEFRTCNEEQEYAYVCSPQFLYSYLTPYCVMAGIYHGIPNECEYVKTTHQNLLFKHLLTQNSWVFSTPQQIFLQITCDVNKHNITIWKTGILKVKQKCYLQLNGTKILYYNTPITAEIKPITANFKLVRHNEDFDIESIEQFQKHSQWSMLG